MSSHVFAQICIIIFGVAFSFSQFQVGNLRGEVADLQRTIDEVHAQRVADHGQVFDQAVKLTLRDPSWLVNYTYRQFASPEQYPQVYPETAQWAIAKLEHDLDYHERLAGEDGSGDLQTGHLMSSTMPLLAYVAHTKSTLDRADSRIYNADRRFSTLIHRTFPNHFRIYGGSPEPRFDEELQAATFILLQLADPKPDPRTWLTQPITAPVDPKPLGELLPAPVNNN